MYKLGETESSELIAKISARLWKAKIPHQVVSKGTDGVPLSEIWLVREEDLALAAEIINSPEIDKVSSNVRSPLVASLSYAKFTWLFLISCLLVFLLTSAGTNIQMVSLFSIVPMEIRTDGFYAGSLESVLSLGEFWRLFSPTLLHFGGFHLVFNLLWIWEFGRRIEQSEGKLRFLMIMLASGVAANLAQYFIGSVLFGGMSGVIYAFLGYMVVSDKLSTRPKYRLPNAIVGFMLGWLVLGLTQFTELIGLGSIANAAHFMGLASGVIIAILVRLLFSRSDSIDPSS